MSNMGNRAFRLPTAFHRRRLFSVEQPAPTEPTDEFGQILKQEPGKERLGKCWPERLIPRLCVFTEAQYIPKMSLGVTLFGTALRKWMDITGAFKPPPHTCPHQNWGRSRLGCCTEGSWKEGRALETGPAGAVTSQGKPPPERCSEN